MRPAALPFQRAWAYVQSEVAGAPASADMTAEDREAWREHRAAAVRTFRVLLLPTAGLLLLWWPEDWLLYGRIQGAPVVLGTIRAVVGTYAIALYLLFPRVRLLRALPLLTIGSAGVLFAGIAGAEFGRLGGPGSAWFHFGDMIVMVPIAIPLSLRERFLTTVAFAAALMAGYFGVHPQYIHDPYTWPTLSYIVGVVALSILTGELAEVSRRRAFFLQRQTERQAAELRGWSERLEHRVEEQSAELRALLIHREHDREDERHHLARELHDDLGQELAALRLALELTRTRFHTDRGAIEPNLVELQMLLDRGQQQLRNTLLGLRPLVLDDLGLVAASRWLTEGVTGKAGLLCELQLPASELVLPPETSVALFRILQESLTNVVRHAGAKRVQVSLTELAGTVELRTTDDGAGFAMGARLPLAGMGLVGVRERARAIGGIAEIHSAPGQGTSVCVRVERPA